MYSFLFNESKKKKYIRINKLELFDEKVSC